MVIFHSYVCLPEGSASSTDITSILAMYLMSILLPNVIPMGGM